MFAFRAYRARTASAVTLMAATLLIPLSATATKAGMLAPIWTGAYAGFHGGTKWGDIDTDFGSAMSGTDWTGGGHIGYNFGLGGIVLGLEADATLDSTSLGFTPKGGGTGSFETDWSGTIRGRAGMPVGPALLYATAGYAWTEATLNEAAVGGGSFSTSHTFHGVVYGLGAEAYVLPNLSLRLEALRFDYAADKLSLSGAQNLVEEFDPSETVVRAGVTFHLN
ncbi:MAG: outer membrane beta-barrel protein [Hyphomicrobium sp.]